MQSRTVANSVLTVILTTLLAGCDFIPEAKEAAQANDDRSQFQTPKNVVTTPGDSQILIQWPSYPGATGYTLYWSNQSPLVSSETRTITVTETKYLHTDLANGVPYHYSISAQTSRGDSTRSGIVIATPSFAVLPAVVMSPIIVGDTRNTLEWQPVSGASSYDLYWSTDLSGEVTSESMQISSVTSPLVHENLDNGLTHYYRIVANNIEQAGNLSAVVSGTPFQRPPTAPSAIDATYTGNALTILFEDVSNASSFDLYWSNSPNVDTSDQHIANIQSPFIHTPLQLNRAYYYRLIAKNAGGSSELSAEISVDPLGGLTFLSGPSPTTPGNINIDLGNRQLSLQWENTDPTVLGYNIYWRTTASGTDSSDNKIANIVPPYTLTGLTNGVPVYYIVTAINNDGESVAATEGLPVIPQIIVPGVPTNVTASSGNSKIAISWPNISGAADYNVHWRQSDNTVTCFTDALSNVSSPAVIDNLSNGVNYSFAVSANNASGQGDKSVSVMSTPQIPRPLAPSLITGQPGNSKILLEWQHAYIDSQTVSGYRIYWSGSAIVDTNIANYIEVNDANTLSYLHQNLVNGRILNYVITAINAGGESSPSAQIQAIPQVDIPDAPEQIKATPGDTIVQVKWLQKAGIQNYNIYWWANSSGLNIPIKTVVANVLPGVVIDTLQNGTRYHFYVAAFNEAGESIVSKEIIATPQVPAPTATTLLFSAQASDAANQLYWDAIPSASRYRLYWSTTSNISPINSAYLDNVQSNFSHTGLINGKTYYYSISGINAGGEGPLSEVFSVTPQIPAPSIPPSQVVISGGDREVFLSWNTQTLENIDSYNVYFTTNPSAQASTWSKIPGFISGDSHKQLRNGTKYYYQVAAVNAGGEGPLSLQLSATSQAAPPVAPSGLSITVIDDTQLAVNWYQVPGVQYTLFWSTSQNVPLSGANSQSFNDVQAIYTHRALTPGTRYYYVVTAQNRVTVNNPNPGPASPASIELSAVPSVISAETPIGLTAIGAKNSTRVQWQNIAATATYTLYWTDDPDIGPQLDSQLANVNSINNVTSPYSHAGLVNGKVYYYVVTATTSNESLPSPVAQTIPQVPPIYAPTGIQAVGGSQQVTVSWNIVPQISYNLYWTTVANTDPLNGTKLSNVTSPYVHLNLADNTAVTYALTAQNAAGESLPSAAFTITPGTNTAPIISQSLEAPLGEVIVALSEDGIPLPFILDLAAFDNEAHALTWSISRQPTMAGAIASVNGNGVSANVTYIPAQNTNGTDTFEVQVSDELGANSSILVTANIEPVNDIPSFTSVPGTTTAFVGANYSYTIQVSDIDTATADLSISALSIPNWLSLTASGVPGESILSGTPSIIDVGNIGNNVTLQVSDAAGGIVEQSFNLTVSNDNAVTSPGNSVATIPNAVTAGQESVINIQSIDTLGNPRTTGGDVIEVIISGANANLTASIFDNSDGSYTARYTPTNAGNDSIAINIESLPIQNSPYTSTVIPAAVDLVKSLVSVPNVGSTGIDTVISVQLMDAFNNNQTGTVVGSISNGVNNTAVFTTTANTTITGLYTIVYQPLFSGSDNIIITVDSIAVPGNPFLSVVSPVSADAGNSAAILPIADGKAGLITTINVELKDLNGNLTSGAITASSLLTPGTAVFSNNQLQDLSYQLSYTPLVSGNDVVTILVAGQPISNSPINQLVLPGDATINQSTVVIPASVASGTPIVMEITARDDNQNLSTGSDSILVAIDAASANANAAVTVAYTTNGIYTATYTPTIAGTDNFTVTINGGSYPAGTFSSVITAGGATVAGSTVVVPATVQSGTANVIEITARDDNQNLSTGTDSILVAIDAASANANAAVTVAYTTNGIYTATYTPTIAGTDNFTVTINGGSYPAGTFSSVITAALGDALLSSVTAPAGIAGSVTTLTINVIDTLGNPSMANDTVTITQAAGSSNITDTISPPLNTGGVGVYTASYTPTLPGEDIFIIKINNVDVPPPTGLPAIASIVSPGGVAINSSVNIPTDININQSSIILVTVRDSNNQPTAGGDSVVFTALDSNGAAITISNGNYIGGGISTGEYSTSYVPTVVGTNSISV
ncbi:MAG: fibronectin type III domain-containing protein, partial [Thiohalomonadales bacterium]